MADSATVGRIVPNEVPAGQVSPQRSTSPEAAMALLVAVLRVVQCGVWPVVLLMAPSSGLRSVGLAVAVYVLQTAWSLTWGALVMRARRIPLGLMTVDAPLAVACLVGSGLACAPQNATTWANSAVTPAIGVALAAGVGLSWRLGAASVAGLVAGYLGGLAPAIDLDAVSWSVAVANVVVLAVAFAAGHLAAGMVRSWASRRDALRYELARARSALAAAEHRERQRRQQYRMLHDTALSTLSALARGGLDAADPLVRRRCAADADYLRALIAAGEAGPGGQLQAALATVARDQAGLGLRAQVRCADLPVGIPDAVVDVLAAAAREALNNVVKHSGTDRAWVTALGAPGAPGVTVTVTDRGRGFAAEVAPSGSGLTRSIGERVVGIGGTLRVRSSPGQGTTIELVWPGVQETGTGTAGWPS